MRRRRKRDTSRKTALPAIPPKKDPQYSNEPGPPYLGQQRYEFLTYGAGDSLDVPQLGTVVYIGEHFYVVEFTFRGYRARAFRESYWRVDPARYCSVVDDPRYARDSYYRRRGGDTL